MTGSDKVILFVPLFRIITLTRNSFGLDSGGRVIRSGVTETAGWTVNITKTEMVGFFDAEVFRIIGDMAFVVVRGLAKLTRSSNSFPGVTVLSDDWNNLLVHSGSESVKGSSRLFTVCTVKTSSDRLSELGAKNAMPGETSIGLQTVPLIWTIAFVAGSVETTITVLNIGPLSPVEL